MSKYVEVKVNVSEGQVKKIKAAIENDDQVVIRLSHEDLAGERVLALTKTQVNQIEKAKASNKGLDIKLSKSQLKHNKTVTGGFLGAILPFLATAAKVVLPALVGGMAMAGGAKAVDAIDRKVQGGKLPKTIYVKSSREGVKLTKVGGGLFLTPWKKHGDVSGRGVWLKPYGGSGYVDGSGLFTGTDSPNSPVRKVPILGQIPLISDLLSMIV